MIRLACFDLDGTLVTGTSSFQFIAEKLGFGELLLEYEAKYRLGVINNIKLADETAHLFKGLPIEQIDKLLYDIPKITNIGPTISDLKRRGIVVILASVTWSFLVEPFARTYGFDSYCGTVMQVQKGLLTGEVKTYGTEQDKLEFFIKICQNHSITRNQTIAIGDSRSDHLVFRAAGMSIALNADTSTKELATHSIDTDNLLDIVPFFD